MVKPSALTSRLEEGKNVIKAVIFDLMGTLAVSNHLDEDWLVHKHGLLSRYGPLGTIDQLKETWEETQTRPSEAGHTPFEEKIHRVAKAMGLTLSWPQTRWLQRKPARGRKIISTSTLTRSSCSSRSETECPHHS